MISPRAPATGGRKAPRHEIASGGSGRALPQGTGAAGALWGFGHAGGADEMRVDWTQRRFFGRVRMSKLLPMRALRVAGSDCECSSLRIEMMNASLGIAGGEPARITLVAVAGRR